MKLYLDTSAFVPLLVDGPASETSRMLWDESGYVYATRLLCVEAVSALTRRGLANADKLVEPWFNRMRVIELDRSWSPLPPTASCWEAGTSSG